jgi:FkbH-like protein
MKFDKVPKFPADFSRTKERFKVLLVGTCNTDSIFAASNSGEIIFSQLLWDSYQFSEIPDFSQFADYDAYYISITLRQIHDSISVGSRGSLSWLDSSSFFDYKEKVVKTIIERCNSFKVLYPNKLLIFGGFLEPSISLEGPAHSLNKKNSINSYVADLNISLSTWCYENNYYFLDGNDIANWIGRRHVVDDTVNGLLHNSTIGDDPMASQTERFLTSHQLTEQYSAWPRNLEYGFLLSNRIAEIIRHCRKTAPIKMIIIDLDETLWRGIHADDDLNMLERTEGWPLGLVETLIEFKRGGGLLAICSKNEEKQTIDFLLATWFDKITIEDFVTYRINREPKEINIFEIMKEINISEDNVLFIDDNPREISKVKKAFPRMRFLNNEHLDWRRTILTSAEFFMNELTAESQHRTELIRGMIKREKSQTLNREGWLENLQLKSKLLLVKDTESNNFSRVFELINKTNQFNLNGVRVSQERLAELISDNDVVAFTLSDRFADNGLVAVIILDGTNIVTFVMSCRVFGLEFEYALLNKIIEVFNINLENLFFHYEDTGKNLVMKQFMGDYRLKCNIKYPIEFQE